MKRFHGGEVVLDLLLDRLLVQVNEQLVGRASPNTFLLYSTNWNIRLKQQAVV